MMASVGTIGNGSHSELSPKKKLKSSTSGYSKIDWKEVEVETSWGTLRGKQCGSGPRRVLGFHGWLDNANTFDLIAPLLPSNVTFLSLDLPGHGNSDHFPTAFIYDGRGYVGAIKKAVISLGWDKFTYLGHSMGAVVGIMYASVFPEDVEAFISIDILKPWSTTPEKYPSSFKKYFTQYFDNETKCKYPPLVYDEEELVKKTMEGSKSLDDRGARIILERGAKRSEDGLGLILKRDLRAKNYFIGFLTFEAWQEMAKSIHCPILLIKATDGHFYEPPDKNEEMKIAFSTNCCLYRYHEIDGKHHIHLTHSDQVGKHLNNFLSECGELNEEQQHLNDTN